MAPLNRKTRLGELPLGVLIKLRTFFDHDDKWIDLANVIHNRRGEEKYSIDDIRNFSLELKKGRSPTEALIRDWGYENASMQNLLKAVSECMRYDVLRWLLVDKMGEMTLDEFEAQSDLGWEGHFENKSTKNTLKPSTVENATPHSSVAAYSEHVFDTYVSGATGGGDVCHQNNLSEVETIEISNRVTRFSYDYLMHLTNRWNDLPVSNGGRVLGCGGYATVFLGKEPHQLMAVKRLKDKDNAHKQFFQEVDTLVQFAHPNIVPLYGVSQDGPYWCIVYQYMENGSLEDRLDCKDDTLPLTCAQRCKIANDIAEGLTYLHTKNKIAFVHRDVKPANILLDCDFSAKLGDCGLAHRGPTDASRSYTTTKTIIGTECYCAPEYMYGEISVKLDAYSFGMVLCEMLTGLDAYDNLRQEQMLSKHIEKSFACDGDKCIKYLVDGRLSGWSMDNVKSVFALARRLTALEKDIRPRVEDVLPEIKEWPENW